MLEYALVSPEGDILAYRFYPEDGEPQGDPAAVAPNKPRLLPIEAEGDDHDPETEVCALASVTVEAARVLRTFAVRAKTEEELNAPRVAKIAEIKAEARRRILAVYPDWKQANMTMEAVALLRIRFAREWTVEEAAAADALEAAKAWVDGVRARSNDLEATVPTDAEEVAAFDPTAGWD